MYAFAKAVDLTVYPANKKNLVRKFPRRNSRSAPPLMEVKVESRSMKIKLVIKQYAIAQPRTTLARRGFSQILQEEREKIFRRRSAFPNCAWRRGDIAQK
jgi:hypothetical protein